MNHYCVHLLSCLFLGNLNLKKNVLLENRKESVSVYSCHQLAFPKKMTKCEKKNSVKLTAKKRRNANVVKNHTLDSVTTHKLNLLTNIIHSCIYLLFTMLNRSVLFFSIS